ncbi:MAG: flagellar FliJ family protein [Alphaproteobacteria bacterium]|nr:flagellar FliJ family protein [Alphaproteobacteria bacterium]
MRTLETLLKLAQRRLDDVGVQAGEAARRLDALAVKRSDLLNRERAEVEAGTSDPAAFHLVSAYRQRVKLALAALDVEIAEAQATSLRIREQLTIAYQEKSRFEQLVEQAVEREAVRLEALDQAALDEAAINRVGRP